RGVRGACGMTRRAIIISIAVATVAASALAYVKHATRGGLDVADTVRCQVERGDLVVSLLQAGELAAKRSEVISNDTGKSAKIISIVEDGSQVKKGDLIVELDSEELRDTLMKQKAEVETAKADLKQAENEAAISELKYKTDFGSCKLEVELAELELRKYQEAEYDQEKLLAENEIKQAEEDLKKSEKDLEWTRKLVAKGYENQQQLDEDELKAKRLATTVEIKTKGLKILEDYTSRTEVSKRENDLKEATGELERLEKTHDSEQEHARANIESKRVRLGIETSVLENLEKQIATSRIYSAYDGFVFYPEAHRGVQEIEKGASVYPRQKILEIPDLSNWEIKCGVPESIIDKTRPGQRALATIDAVPGEILEAVVEKIGSVPDTSRWYDRSSKIYTVTLSIPTTPTLDLKPGMSVMTEIIINDLKDVLYVPIQAVAAEGDARFVYAPAGRTFKRVPVEVGASNESRIQILAGLDQGQEILLYAPVGAETRVGLKERPLDKVKARNGEEEREPSETADRSEPSSTSEEGEADKVRELASPEGQVESPGREEGAGGVREGESRRRPDRSFFQNLDTSDPEVKTALETVNKLREQMASATPEEREALRAKMGEAMGVLRKAAEKKTKEE
ncbi:MAG TPA: efflux RND transporter periplasmic adaptor subunit, partial [Sumerlaeia bacterium]|nr:efflux RND transporter periplasmic adaptor subunit [Sumerlaeia bacterium]